MKDAQCIINTEAPFLQVILDKQPSFSHEIARIGDAIFLTRPHTASGVLRALQHAIQLSKIIGNTQEVEAIISQLNKFIKETAFEEISKAVAMGDSLVMKPLDWNKMNQQKMDIWWADFIKGKTWYAIDDKKEPKDGFLKGKMEISSLDVEVPRSKL